ncbi:MAG: CPBP family intramembrane glutamic endopeptidase [Allosphingosinicella sp.]
MTAIVLGSDRFLAPGRWLWLRALGWGVALFVLLTLAAGLAAAAVAALAGLAVGMPVALAVMPATGPGQIGYVVGAAAALGAYVGLVRLCERRRADELALAPAPIELAAGLAIGAAMMAVTVLLLYFAGGVTLARHPVESIWNAVALSVQSGFVEEILFRLVVLRLVWRAFGPWPALAFSACLFGALHLFNPNATAFAALAIAIEAGIMLAAFYILTGRLWVSIGVHAGWNFTQGWLFGAAVSGTGGFAGGPLLTLPVPGTPQWLSGGAFGPEASVAGLLVGTLVGLAVLGLAARRGAFLPGEAKAGTEAAPGA